MTEAPTICAVCLLPVESVEAWAGHLVAEAGRSDIAHVMWLNRNVTKHRVTPAELAELLRRPAKGEPTGEGRVRR